MSKTFIGLTQSPNTGETVVWSGGTWQPTTAQNFLGDQYLTCGATYSNFVDLSSNQTIGGLKIFSNFFVWIAFGA